LDDFAGNAISVYGVTQWWNRLHAVSFQIVTDNTVADRTARLRFFADEPVPSAETLAPFVVQASHTSQVTFALGVQPAGATNAASIIGVLPELLLPIGWSVELDVVGGVAGDAVSGVRVVRQRFQLIDLD
jgi:hypothetical protein